MEQKSQHPPLEAVVAVALVSFSILAAEVALSRVFSVLFRAPYVFLIVSGAIGGLGLGGLLVQWVRPAEARLRHWIAGLCVALALALAAPTLLLFASPWGRGLVAGAETGVVVAVPMVTFCIAGALLSLIFRWYSQSGGFLYFVDLAAAALAAPAAVLLLNALGAVNTPLVLALATAVAGLAIAFRADLKRWTVIPALAALLLAAVLGTNLTSRWIDLPPMKAPIEALNDRTHRWHTITKPLFVELGDPFAGSRIVRTDWTAVSRTDVVYDPSQQVYYIYTDGDVPTQMEAWDGSYDSARRTYGRFIGTLPYRLREKAPERVMAIGSGGGLDVLLARAAGAKTIDAVEINPSIPAIVRDPRFQETYARVYQEPGVSLVVDEGRSFLQRAGKYDLIYFACAKTATTQTSGVALLDNHLYTVEAFRDYWRHLADDGMLALVTQEAHVTDRLWLTAITALGQEGIPPAEAADHLVMARVPQEQFGFGPYRHILTLSRQPWKTPRLVPVMNAIQANGLEPLYVPDTRPYAAGGARIDNPGDLKGVQAKMEAQYPVPEDLNDPQNGKTVPAHLAAVTDDSPFYVDISRGLHPSLLQLLQGSAAATAIVLVLVFVTALRERHRDLSPSPAESAPRVEPAVASQPPADPSDHAFADPSAPTFQPCNLPTFQPGSPLSSTVSALAYFSMLGAGFMLVELALMQRFILLLGFPTRSLSVTLFALLVSSALGSRMTQRGAPADAGVRLRRMLPLLVGLLVLYRFVLPPVLEALLPFSLPIRIAATMFLLAPAGFLMGMAFPTALRCLTGASARMIPAYWSVNGVTSILGSVATMAIAKFSGYGTALLIGAGCYLIAWAVFPWITPTRKSATQWPTPERLCEEG